MLLLAACNNEWGYGMHIDPGTKDARWRAEVIAASEEWNLNLAPCGGQAIIVREGGWTVELYDGEGWPDYVGGRFDGCTVRVREGQGQWEYPILLHELGHALGFEHISEEEDPYSIMNPSSEYTDRITEGDVARGLAFFGCKGE